MTDYKQQLLERLHNRSAKVGIVGMGYVGLPLAVEFARAGFTVVGLDVQAEKADKLNAGISYIPDVPTEDLAPLVKAGKMRATTSYDDLRDADGVSICVPTPLRKTKDPDTSYVIAAGRRPARGDDLLARAGGERAAGGGVPGRSAGVRPRAARPAAPPGPCPVSERGWGLAAAPGRRARRLHRPGPAPRLTAPGGASVDRGLIFA